MDVEEWINQENVSRILDFWEAWDRVNALPDSWKETATICQQISLNSSITASSVGSEIPTQPFGDFMPPRWVPPAARKPRVVTDEEVADRLDRIYRVKQ